jgi:predicted membrane protein
MAWLVAGTHLIRLSAEGVLAVALMVLGATTVVTARTDWALSRRAWPIMLGAGLVLALIVTSVSPRFPGGIRDLRIGSQTLQYTLWADVPPAIKGGVGRTLVDFTPIQDDLPADTTVDINGGLGLVRVQLPPNVHVHVNAQVGIGSITINQHRSADGVSPSAQEDLGPSGGHLLTLNISSSVGPVRVVQPARLVPPAPPVPPAQPNQVRTA